MKLEIRDLHVSYGGIRALKGIDLTVEEGQIVTLIGANGAGKSTTLRAISGLQKPQSGSILYGGEVRYGVKEGRMLTALMENAYISDRERREVKF